MAEEPRALDESWFRRVRHQWGRDLQSWRRDAAGAVVLTAVTVLSVAFIGSAWWAGLTAALGTVLLLGLWSVVRVPFLQRNEARSALASLRGVVSPEPGSAEAIAHELGEIHYSIGDEELNLAEILQRAGHRLALGWEPSDPSYIYVLVCDDWRDRGLTPDSVNGQDLMAEFVIRRLIQVESYQYQMASRTEQRTRYTLTPEGQRVVLLLDMAQQGSTL